jgi:hypothetical protein
MIEPFQGELKVIQFLKYFYNLTMILILILNLIVIVTSILQFRFFLSYLLLPSQIQAPDMPYA